jgi:hypothetical protein
LPSIEDFLIAKPGASVSFICSKRILQQPKQKPDRQGGLPAPVALLLGKEPLVRFRGPSLDWRFSDLQAWQALVSFGSKRILQQPKQKPDRQGGLPAPVALLLGKEPFLTVGLLLDDYLSLKLRAMKSV